jgi:hypothetical protein
MFTQSDYLMNEIYEQKRAAIQREFKEERMLRRAGLIKPGLIARFGSHIAGSLGHILVSLGRRLERIERMDSASPAVRATRAGAAD